MNEKNKKRSDRRPRSGGRSDDAHAFLPDPSERGASPRDDLAQMLAEEFLESATSGEERGEEVHEEPVDEEVGGPFVPSTGSREFATGSDPSNPPDAERAPFPTTQRSG